MASTSTSDGCRCAAASGCRIRQRSRPSSASSFALRPTNFNERPARLPQTSRLLRSGDGSAPGRLHARGLVGLLSIVRRPRRIAETLSFLSCRQVEQPVERAWVAIDVGVNIAQAREPLRHRREREIPGLRQFSFFPRQRRRHACIGCGTHRVRGGHGAIFCVLVVIDKHAVPLFLPPLAGRQFRRAAFDFARERQRRASHLVEGPLLLDAHVHVHATRT